MGLEHRHESKRLFSMSQGTTYEQHLTMKCNMWQPISFEFNQENKSCLAWPKDDLCDSRDTSDATDSCDSLTWLIWKFRHLNSAFSDALKKIFFLYIVQ